MIDPLSLFAALLAVLLSLYWFKRQQASTTEEPSTSEKKVKEEVEVDSTATASHRTVRSKDKTKTSEIRARGATTKTRNKHQIPSDPRFLRRYGGHAGVLTAFSASPDGRWLATAGADGQIRVAKVDEAGFSVSATVKTPGMGVFQDHLSAISWLPSSDSHPTIVGTIAKSRQIAFYRIRRKKNAATTNANKMANSSSQYELIELVKRRFDICGKVEEGDRVVACLADQFHGSNSNSDCLVLTKTEYDPKRSRLKHPNTVAWNADGEAVGSVHTNSPGVRISPDGAFLCGRGGVGAPEAKVFEVRRRKVKGAAEPVFDSIPSKSAMTLVPRTSKAKVADVAFCGERDNMNQHHLSLAVVACEDGAVEVWDLDVDHRRGEDARFVCSANAFDSPDEDGAAQRTKINCIATSVAVSVGGGASYRIAVATDDSALHLLSYSVEKADLSVEFSIENSAHREGVGELQFCPSSGNLMYSTGRNNSREVFSWKLD